MKKTIVALMALSGSVFAFDDTIWNFESSLASEQGEGLHSAKSPSYGTWVEGTEGSYTWTTGTPTYEETGVLAGATFGEYKLTEALGQALVFSNGSTVKYGDSYWAYDTDSKIGMGQNFSNSYTLMAYVKFDDASKTNTIFATGDANKGLAFGLRDGNLNLMAKGLSDHTVSYTLSSNTWYNIAVSYDASIGTAVFYVNGDVAGTIENLKTAAFDAPGGEKSGFGSKRVDAREELFSGQLAQFQILDGALTQSQILQAAHLVPEPTTATLSLLALAGLAARRRRK